MSERSDEELTALVRAMHALDTADPVDYPKAIAEAQADIDRFHRDWSDASERLIVARAHVVARWRRAETARRAGEVSAIRDEVAVAYEHAAAANKRLAALEAAVPAAQAAALRRSNIITDATAAQTELTRRAEAAKKAAKEATAQASTEPDPADDLAPDTPIPDTPAAIVPPFKARSTAKPAATPKPKRATHKF